MNKETMTKRATAIILISTAVLTFITLSKVTSEMQGPGPLEGFRSSALMFFFILSLSLTAAITLYRIVGRRKQNGNKGKN